MFKISSKLLLSITATILSFSGVICLQKKYLKNLYIAKNIDYQQQENKLKLEANFQKNMPSLGFNNLVADWAFLKYIQYLGDAEARDKTGYSVVTDYFETIVDRDPKFIKANLSLSTSNSLFAGDPEKTIALLEKSLKSLTPNMPDYPFMISAYKAVDEIIFLSDLEAAQQSYEKAAQWAESRGDKIGINVANNYRNTIKFLASNPDSIKLELSGWTMILKNNSRDRKIREYAMQKIRDLGGEIIISADGEIMKIKPPETDV